MTKFKRSIIVTGGAGFIGSHVVRLLTSKYPEYLIINVDALTYAGNLENLRDVEDAPNYLFKRTDICDASALSHIIGTHNVTGIIHLAAESHVDRSILDPITFARTNVLGTLTLLQCARAAWEASPDKYAGKLFYHISTDEVYGSLKFDDPKFTESTPYSPHSPYSASKASSDHFVRAFHDTYGMPTVITNCSNNYGPYQFPEKLIPLFINNICNKRDLPVYGDGRNVRDWLYVEDHARAIDLIFHKGHAGQTYNIGGNNELSNIDLVHKLIETTDRIIGNPPGSSLQLIKHVSDRQGHDLRYAIDAGKLRHELGWRPQLNFEEGLEQTVRWYLDNPEWLQHITSGEYENYYTHMYANR